MTTPASNPPVSNTVSPTAVSAQSAEIVPSSATLLQAAKLAITEDRAIMLDYFRQTANGTAFLGEDPETKERILVKSKDEFTSLIKKLYKSGDDFIILTENSLYIVSGKIQKRKVNLASLQEAYENNI
jgi:hypothetical protein